MIPIENIVTELDYLQVIERDIMQKIHRNERQIEEIAATAYQGEDYDFPLCRRMPLTRLSVVTYLLIRKYHEYKSKGIPEDIIFDTFKDVSLRAALYYRKAGKSGISKEDVIWFRHIMNVSIFKIGSLQFQPFKMIYLDEETLGEPYMTFTKEQKAALPEGSPVLNCHIQRGADLRPDKVGASFQAAKSFFSEHFPEEPFQAFLCYSWLLYPPMQELLLENSRIKRFAARFSVIGACFDPEQATECLFGHRARKEAAAHLTRLQQMALEHPHQFGFACGIIPI